VPSEGTPCSRYPENSLPHEFTSTARTQGTQVVVIRVDLLSSHPLCRSLGSPSGESIALLGVAEDPATEDVEFLILLDKSVGDNTIVIERAPKDGREHASQLRRN